MSDRSADRRSRSDVKRAGAAYQGALEAVLAIPIAVGLGYLADRQLGTFPVCLLIGVGIGFAAFVLRFWRLGQQIRPEEDGGDGSNGPGRGE